MKKKIIAFMLVMSIATSLLGCASKAPAQPEPNLFGEEQEQEVFDGQAYYEEFFADEEKLNAALPTDMVLIEERAISVENGEDVFAVQLTKASDNYSFCIQGESLDPIEEFKLVTVDNNCYAMITSDGETEWVKVSDEEADLTDEDEDTPATEDSDTEEAEEDVDEAFNEDVPVQDIASNFSDVISMLYEMVSNGTNVHYVKTETTKDGQEYDVVEFASKVDSVETNVAMYIVRETGKIFKLGSYTDGEKFRSEFTIFEANEVKLPEDLNESELEVVSSEDASMMLTMVLFIANGSDFLPNEVYEDLE